MFKTILAATDGSEHAQKAVSVAGELAAGHNACDASLHLLCVAEDIPLAADAHRPAVHIADYARRVEAELVVVGEQGLGGCKRPLIGSVAQRVNHLSGCSCLTAR